MPSRICFQKALAGLRIRKSASPIAPKSGAAYQRGGLVPCEKVIFPLFRLVYVVRGCVRGCSRGRETPSAPSGLVPLRGGQFWHPHGEQNSHYGRRMANKTAIMAAHGGQKGRYDPVQSLSNPPKFRPSRRNQNVMKCL